MNIIKSVFLPKLEDNGNPYQNQLAEHLTKLGVQVEGIRSIIFLPTVVMQWKADILHLHWLDLFVITYGRTRMLKSRLTLVVFISQLVILKLMGVKIVWTAHNLKNHENQYLKLDRICTTLVVRLSHAIIAHCDSAKREIATAFHLKNDEKIFVVPHGNYIDYYENKLDPVAARKSLGLINSDLILLFLGYIRPYKGVLEMIEAFQQIHYNQMQLVIAGKADDESTELIRHKIKGYDNINFIPGFVAEDQIQVYMNACDVVVFPYRDILTSGGVVLAMSFSRACIAPRQGCIGEVLDDVGAFLYDPGSEEGLLQAINCAIERKANLLRMGEHNRKLAKQCNWDRVAEMTLDVYQQCLSR